MASSISHLASVRSLFRHYLSQRPMAFATLSACVLAAAGCAVATQYAMKVLIDALADNQRLLAPVWSSLGTFLALVAIESLLWRACGLLACRVTVAMGVQIRLDLMQSLTERSLEYFTETMAGSIGQRVTGTAGSAGALVNTVVWRIVPPVVDFLGALTIFTLIDWPMGAAITVYVGVVGVALLVAGARGQALHKDYFDKATQVAGDLVDVITNIWVVKAFSSRKRESRRLAQECNDEAVSQQRSWMYTERIRFAYDIVLWVMAAGMLGWSILEWTTRKFSAGDVVVISTLTFRLLHGSRDAALALVDAGQQASYVRETVKLVRQAPIVAAAQTNLCPLPQGDLVFKDVTFAFSGREPLFQNFNLHIKFGERLGIVGASGSGKTTLLQLIQRQYDVQIGQISMGGRVLNSHNTEALSRMLAVVPQEVSLFHRSISDNIRIGRPSALDEEVFSAAVAAHCDEFVVNHPAGFDSLVGERGLKLSGGQRQRVGIARAILKDSSFVLLDEATSALDTETELAVQRSLLRLSQGKTVIAVAHRLSTLSAFDRIIVLDRGRIVGDGTPAGLMRSNIWFRRMWMLQAQGLFDEQQEDPFH